MIIEQYDDWYTDLHRKICGEIEIHLHLLQCECDQISSA